MILNTPQAEEQRFRAVIDRDLFCNVGVTPVLAGPKFIEPEDQRFSEISPGNYSDSRSDSSPVSVMMAIHCISALRYVYWYAI